MPACTFIRVLEATDKAEALAQAVAGIRRGEDVTGTVFQADPDSFRAVPTTPFAYWVSDRVRKLFTELPPFESEGRTAKQGLATADDFRFVRAWWEVAPERIVRGTVDTTPDEFRQQTFEGRPWVPFAKGGAYSPYYADLHLVVNWGQDGAEIRNNLNEAGKVRSNVWMLRETAQRFFFRPGLTWPRRTTSGISFRVLPASAIFADKGPAVFADDLLELLSVVQSRVFEGLVTIQVGAADAAARSYEVGLIQRCPVPASSLHHVRANAERCIRAKMELGITYEIGHLFVSPFRTPVMQAGLAVVRQRQASQLSQLLAQAALADKEAQERIRKLYGLSDQDVQALVVYSSGTTQATDEEAADHENAEEALDIEANMASAVLSYLLGTCFGRWDMRFATGERTPPDLPDPFAPLPACSPGMLQGPGGLPARPGDVPDSYPLRISWKAILVDDEGHPEDVVGRVREAMAVIWKETSADIEQELCQELGVNSLRDYFRTPGGFFDDHLKQYSRSRRKAPIYWPLSTPSGSYTLWLYYPRLTDQTLYQCVNDYVDPKLRQVQEEAEVLRQRPARSAKEERALERLLDFQQELTAFRQELLRVAAFWRPHLDDGVQITAAPLWRLFRHKGWQRVLKETWAALEQGEYDWAHLASSIWPDRVTVECKTDKSLAIAHGLESLYVEPEAPPKGRRSRKAL